MTLCLALACHGLARAEQGEIAQRSLDFELRTIFGERFQIEAIDSPWVVVTFLGVECPLARLYAPRLVALEQEFAQRGVTFVAVSANRQDSVTQLQRFYREFELTFPLVKDVGNRWADLLEAERTPEVFVLDRAGAVRYSGRVDDQYGIGFQRPNPTRRDLAVALEELLSGQAVSRPHAEAPGCLIGRVRKPNPQSAVTWCGQVARIMQEHCQSCHREGQVAPFPLVDYEHVAGWAEMIGEVVQQQRMPPWHASGEYGHFANEARLPTEDREAILTWVKNGAPFGNKEDLPPPREFTAGWQISEPHQVVYISDEPVEIPAEGTIDYRYFTVDPEFEEDVWIREVECRPGNTAVVHHMTAWIWMPGEPWIESFRHFLGGSALGWGHMQFPEGTARRVPAGAKIVFVLHYTAVGAPQTDRSYMGLVYESPETVEQGCWTVAADRTDFVIPPYESNVEIEAWYEFERSVRLVAMFPHMHLRGKSFRYVAHWPDGESEVLLDVPAYDFNWQENYILAEQRLLPAGTRVQCIGTYDNSTENPDNPDPSATVIWGHQSWDEMMDGFLIVAAEDGVGEIGGPRNEPHWLDALWPWVAVSGAAIIVLVPAVQIARRRRRGATKAHVPAEQRYPAWRWCLACAAVVIVPAAILLETHLALSAGWMPDSQILVQAATGAAWLVLALAGAAVVLPGSRHWLARRAPHVVMAMVALMLTWLTFEVAWATWVLTRDPHLQPADARYQLEPDEETYFGITGAAVSEFNSQGIRGSELPSDRRVERVLALGGSTTEGLFLGDDETWPAQLAAALDEAGKRPYWVGSAAATGCAMQEHVEFVERDPLLEDIDRVVVLGGVHDLITEILPDPSDEADGPLWYRSGLLRRFRDVWARRVALGPLGDVTGRVYESGRRFQEIPPRDDADWDAALNKYAHRLEALQRAARQRGLNLVLITQPVLWSDDLSWEAKKRLVLARVVPAGREWPLLTPESLARLIERYNEVMRESCRQNATDLVDAAATMSGNEALFYDDYHLNEAGCAQLGQLVAKHLGRADVGEPTTETAAAD